MITEKKIILKKGNKKKKKRLESEIFERNLI